MTHWGNVLKEARIRAGLTQEELAAEVGISVSYLRKMETGLLGPPLRDKAEKLAEVLNITDAKERNAFFRAAEVGNDEDMQGLILIDVEDGEADDDDFTFGTPVKTPHQPSNEDRRSDETAQLRQLLAQVDALRATIQALITEKEQKHGRRKRP